MAVIGGGLIGHGNAQVFLAGGHAVALHDRHGEALNSAHDKIQAFSNCLSKIAHF
ncbi:MAG: hypothetical protein KTR16_02385 [Acidiferrobacterales bacterium]|nr:hypothetical protein [Acidiferrobacterales bacterium]